MTRARAVVGSLVFLVIVPGTVAGVVPFLISHWRIEPLPNSFVAMRVLGVALIVAGLPILLESFARFALEGLGTPAPVAPPRHLVVKGPYRYVRNPMYVAVLAMIAGQAMFFANLGVLEYGFLVWLAFHAFVRLLEEPQLRARFGAEYTNFCSNVPRWIPRLRPWTGRSRG